MGWGTIYEVPNSAKALLATRHKKGEWYDALGKLNLESVQQLNAEDSIRFWASKLREIGHPAALFFEGELHAAYDEYDDPNVCFNGSDAVKVFVTHLEQLGKKFFVELFPRPSPSATGDSWLYEPMLGFLREVQNRENAVVLLWER